jgi:hypothetical protein
MTIYDLGERIIFIIGIVVLLTTLCLIYKIFLIDLREEHIKEKRNIRESAKNTQKALKKANKRC